jgi:signal transduction histidine kinase
VDTDVPPDGTFEARLWSLARAAVAIGSQRTGDDLLPVIAEQARAVVGTHLAAVSLTVRGSDADDSWRQRDVAVSWAPAYAASAGSRRPTADSPLYPLVCAGNQIVRLTDDELRAHPRWRDLEAAADHPPLRGWLAAPLVASDGTNLGLLQLTDRQEGDFVAVDEAIVLQLAQLASIAVENARLQEQLVSREREQLTQDLLAGLSHDLQTPLAVILGAMQFLQAAPDAPVERRTELYGLLHTQADRLQQLVQRLLDYVRLESDQLVVLRQEPLDLPRLLDDLVVSTGADRLAPIEYPAELPPIEGDPDRLTQVLANLVGNAIKFSADPVRLRLRADRSGVAIDVIDTGEGIDPAELDLVFDQLYRTERTRRSDVPGHGLGLYLSRSLVRAMGGTLSVTSTPGAGSCFTVWLPGAGEGRT